MLWETSTGRLISTPARHVQPVSCVVATPFHVLTGSDDSDIHVWSLTSLLELTPASAEHEPERSLSNHRAAITALSVSASVSYDTNLCVSASKDKSCIVWNYQTGDALRTLLFPSFPLCMSLDPAARAFIVGCEDSSLYMAEFFKGDGKALLGSTSEDSATVMQISQPFGSTQSGSGSVGPASCLAFSYDGTTLLTGHPRGQIMKWDVVNNKAPVELTNLNAAVTNLVFVPPTFSDKGKTAVKTTTIVKPNQAERAYTVTTQLEADLRSKTRVDELMNSTGFSQLALEKAVAAFREALAEKEGEKKE